MTQEEFNVMLQTAIAQGLPGGYYTSKFSGEEVDELLGNVEDGAPFSRPNLLDNARWDNPDNIIDQRGGYVVPPDTPYYSDTGLATQAGTVSAYTTAVYVDGTYGTITVDGAEHYVDWTAAVRGYVGSDSYSIDRWRSNVVVLIEDGYLRLYNQSDGAVSWWQRVPFLSDVRGKIVTYSILTHGAGLISVTHTIAEDGTGTNYSTPIAELGVLDIYLNTSAAKINCFEVRIRTNAGCEISPIAAKLELGDTQTLARQDENGNWVLIDPPPKKSAELAECQRYLAPLSKNGWGRWRCVCYTATWLLFSIPVSVEMRARPVLSGKLDNIHIQTTANTRVDGFTFRIDGYGPGWVDILATKTNHGLTDGQIAIESANAGTVFFDANL